MSHKKLKRKANREYYKKQRELIEKYKNMSFKDIYKGIYDNLKWYQKIIIIMFEKKEKLFRRFPI